MERQTTRDGPSTSYQDINWGRTELELLAGQHRKQTLEQCIIEKTISMDNEYSWICKIYDITDMPADIRVELTANVVAAQKPQSSGEICHDMHHIAPILGRSGMASPIFLSTDHKTAKHQL